MLSEDGRWDPATALGLRSSERVLVVGIPAFLPWLTELYAARPENLVGARKPSEIEAFLKEGQHFDRVILTKETAYSHDHLLRAGAMHAQLVFFPSDDGWQADRSVEFYYPEARSWKFDTTFGPVAVVEPHGPSWRLLYA